MRKYFLASCFIICAMVNCLNAQPNPEGQPKRRGDLNALRKTYIASRLQLTEAEAEKFWPVMNELEKEQKAQEEAFAKRFPNPDFKNMSDAQLEEFMLAEMEQQQKMLDLRKQHLSRLKTVLPMRKLAMLHRANKDFKREVIERVRNKRMQGGGKMHKGEGGRPNGGKPKPPRN